jgi:DNA-binding Xre family transcriptional regulator
LEEMMRARGVTQAELARTLGWHTSNLSRIVAGKRPLTSAALRPIAAALECSPGDLLHVIGAPISERDRAIATEPPPGFDRRLQAVLSLLGLETIEQLAEFMTTGNYDSWPQPIARRLRKILGNNRRK